ncbi:MAG: low molecular weight phosphotyrosine protein phosphatase, partial [Anaerovibrio sp.]|nr:low molecular weight phosphotyrosine protein phosphatase [Anaerovibrio sp.]
QVQRADYEKYDYLIGMDRENLRDLMELTDNDPQHKISLLLSFAGEEREVADPWYTGDFSATYEDVQRGCQALLEKLKHQESI